MTPTEFDAAQRLLGLNNTELAEALGTDDGSISRWKKGKAAIPSYIEVSLRLLESRTLTETLVPLSLEEISALYRKIQASGKTIGKYLADLMRKDLTTPERAPAKISYPASQIASSRLNEPTPEDLKGKQSA